jgi:5-methylcytosine-specific restriction endonuclease McrA
MLDIRKGLFVVPFKDPEKKRLYDQQREKRFRGRRNEQQRAWAASNREKVSVYSAVGAHRRRALEGSDLTADDVRFMRHSQLLCAYCLSAPADCLDHCTPIGRAGSNSVSNVVMACSPCNHRKTIKTPLEFLFNWPRLDATRKI